MKWNAQCAWNIKRVSKAIWNDSRNDKQRKERIAKCEIWEENAWKLTLLTKQETNKIENIAKL